jgi:RNA polymerase sigma-70 factor (ECF subfamily)
MTDDDTALAKRAARGDRAAFARLVETHYDTAYRVAYRMTISVEDAEDIAQDVCMTLPARLGGFHGRSRFSTWLYRVVVNAARDHFRRQKSHRALQSNYAVFREMDEADRAHDAERLDRLGDAIVRLPDELKETAVLVLGEALTHREAGEVLGCAEGTVSWRMAEIRRRLKALMEPENE